MTIKRLKEHRQDMQLREFNLKLCPFFDKYCRVIRESSAKPPKKFQSKKPPTKKKIKNTDTKTMTDYNPDNKKIVKESRK